MSQQPNVRVPNQPHLYGSDFEALIDANLKEKDRVALITGETENYVSWSCVDGREDELILGTPGGFSGELVLGLRALEKKTKMLAFDEIVNVLKHFYDNTLITLYYHTDSESQNALMNAIGEHVISGQHWKELLVLPEHVGCGHMKVLLEDPDLKEITVKYIKAFYHFRKSLGKEDPRVRYIKPTNRIDYDIVPGPHEEVGLLSVTAIENTNKPEPSRRWAIRPCASKPTTHTHHGSSKSFFVYHSDLAPYFRQKIAEHLEGWHKQQGTVQQATNKHQVSATDLLAEMNQMFDVVLKKTLNKLLAFKCVYNVELSDKPAQQVNNNNNKA